MKNWVRQASGVNMLNVDTWLNTQRGPHVKGTIHLNIEPPGRENLKPEDVVAQFLGTREKMRSSPNCSRCRTWPYTHLSTRIV